MYKFLLILPRRKVSILNIDEGRQMVACIKLPHELRTALRFDLRTSQLTHDLNAVTDSTWEKPNCKTRLQFQDQSTLLSQAPHAGQSTLASHTTTHIRAYSVFHSRFFVITVCQYQCTMSLGFPFVRFQVQNAFLCTSMSVFLEWVRTWPCPAGGRPYAYE